MKFRTLLIVDDVWYHAIMNFNLLKCLGNCYEVIIEYVKLNVENVFVKSNS